MKTSLGFLSVALICLVVCGCGDGKPHTHGAATSQVTTNNADKEADIQDNLAKLSPEDAKLAQAQQYCAVESENRLGTMGVPVKVLVKDEPVFLCCKGCQKQALADPDRTLARVQELKEKHGKASAK